MNRETSFTPTVADHVQAWRAWIIYFLKRPIMGLLGLLYALLMLVTVASGIESGEVLPAVVAGGLGMLFGGIQLLHWTLMPRRIRRLVRQQPALLTPTRAAWDDAGFELANEAGVWRVRWAELHRWYAGAHGFVLLPQDYLLLVLPARALNEDQAQDLRSLLVAHVRRRH